MNSKCAVRRKLQRNMQNKWKCKTNGANQNSCAISFNVYYAYCSIRCSAVKIAAVVVYLRVKLLRDTHKTVFFSQNKWLNCLFFFQIWFEYTIAIAAYFQILFYWSFAIDLASIEILLFRLFCQIKLVKLECADFINRNDVFFPLLLSKAIKKCT